MQGIRRFACIFQDCEMNKSQLTYLCAPLIQVPKTQSKQCAFVLQKRQQRDLILQTYKYYTSKTNKMQGFLVNFTIFVDYADFYVNMIMSTRATSKKYKHANLLLRGRCWGNYLHLTTKYWFCKISFKTSHVGKFYLPTWVFVQLNDKHVFSF